MNLATQIKAARARLGLSQSEAASAWRVSLRTLQGWEQARRSPNGAIVARLWPILFPAGLSVPSKRKKTARG